MLGLSVQPLNTSTHPVSINPSFKQVILLKKTPLILCHAAGFTFLWISLNEESVVNILIHGSAKNMTETRGLKPAVYFQSVDVLLNMWHYKNWRSVHLMLMKEESI